MSPTWRLFLLVAIVAFATGQNTPNRPPSPPAPEPVPETIPVSPAPAPIAPAVENVTKCPDPAEYIDTINEITDTTLTSFSKALPILEPLAMPLQFGLAATTPTPGTTVHSLYPTITRNGLGMKLLASTLVTMVDNWASAAKRLAELQSTAASIIGRINEITKTTLTNLGNEHSGLKIITDPLASALTFSPTTSRGNSVFNFDLTPSTVAYNLKLFSGNITEMADRWAVTTDRYLREEKACGIREVINRPLPGNPGSDRGPPGCTASMDTRRAYITAVNQITHTSLTAFARSKPIFIGLTTPMSAGLTLAPAITTEPGTSIAKLSNQVTITGMGMRLLGKTLVSLVDKWEEAQAKYLEQENVNCLWDWMAGRGDCVAPITARFNFINTINDMTRTMLNDLGRTQPRLARITTPLSFTLSFSPLTLLGTGLFNFNVAVTKTGENLKDLAATLNTMADKWDQAKGRFLEQEAADCKSGNGVVEVATTTTTTVAPPRLSTSVSEVCSANQTTRAATINEINSYTRKLLTDYGRDKPRIRPLATTIWLGLTFSPYTQKGLALYNLNQDVQTTAEELRAFAQEMIKMTNEWEVMANGGC